MKKVLFLVPLVAVLGGCQTTSEASQQGTRMVASWYQCCKVTASGQRFNPEANTVAHRTMPFGTKLRLTNPQNNRSVVVTVNDRGPFTRGRHLDVSRGVARQLDFKKSGTLTLNVQVLGRNDG